MQEMPLEYKIVQCPSLRPNAFDDAGSFSKQTLSDIELMHQQHVEWTQLQYHID